MTYCMGVLVDDGLVMIADTRTNAGIDNISIYQKLHTLADDDERLIFVATAGSLSVTQSMLAMLAEGLGTADEAGLPRLVAGCPTMFRVAQLVGDAMVAARRSVETTLVGTRINARASVLLGGRIGDAPLQLYLIYNEGNFIECHADAPFLQIGEYKYGKPILDRALTRATSLDEAVKVGLISFDSTLRSNLSVGLPLDLVAIPADRALPLTRLRLSEDDAYFRTLSHEWSRMLNDARGAIADPPFMTTPHVPASS